MRDDTRADIEALSVTLVKLWYFFAPPMHKLRAKFEPAFLACAASLKVRVTDERLEALWVELDPDMRRIWRHITLAGYDHRFDCLARRMTEKAFRTIFRWGSLS